MAKARMLGRISKVEDQGDGTILVYGIASTPKRDSDGESFTADCMRDAIPDYMAKRRALREMHQSIAAGTTTELFVDDDDTTRITAHVVDPVSVKKVQTGVLKMFSIEGVVPPGGRDTKDRKVINKLKLREISLVDIGSNEDANLEGYEVVKLDGEGDDVEGENEVKITPPEGAVTSSLISAGALTTDVLGLPVAKADDKPTGDTVRKGLYGVSRFAELLQSLGSQASDAQYESTYEGDNSPLPQKMRDWLAAGAEILKAMTEEETAELLKSLAPPESVTVVALADGAKPVDDNVEKEGAKFSAATKAKLKAVQDCLAECMKALETEDEDDAAKVAGPAESEDAIAKVAKLEDSVAKVTAERDTLKKQNETLTTELNEAKEGVESIAKQLMTEGRIRSIDKASDGQAGKADEVKKSEAASATPRDAMKQALQSGKTITPRQ